MHRDVRLQQGPQAISPPIQGWKTMSQKRALIVIDVQNDYFPGGGYPLWQPEETLANIEAAIAKAHAQNVAVILVQHVDDGSDGPSPFFNIGTEGVKIHPRILAAAPEAPVVTKAYGDAFHATKLEALLAERGITEILVCGMMTQNCVTHTAISRAADKYTVRVLADCCTTVDEMVHLIALSGMSTVVKPTKLADELG